MTKETVTVEIDKRSGNIKFDVDGMIGEGCNVIEQIEQTVGTQISHQDKDERFQYHLQEPVPVGTTE